MSDDIRRVLEFVAADYNDIRNIYHILSQKNIDMAELAKRVLAGESLDEILTPPDYLICPFCLEKKLDIKPNGSGYTSREWRCISCGSSAFDNREVHP